MSTSTTVRQWDTTAANNDDADTGINWAEGQDPGTVNNSARAMMAAVARFVKDQGGAITGGGTADAHTVTTNSLAESAHLTDGFRIAYYAPGTNTVAGVTVAVDGIAAKTIKRADGSALAVGSIVSDMILDLAYEAGAGVFRAVNILPAGATPAATASFRAHKNGSAQTISSSSVTQLTFGTEAFDVGGYFSSSTWTPPAGTGFVGLVVTCGSNTPIAADSTFIAYIYVDGVEAARASTVVESSGDVITLVIHIPYEFSGSNAVTYQISSSDSSYDILGTATRTYAYGFMI